MLHSYMQLQDLVSGVLRDVAEIWCLGFARCTLTCSCEIWCLGLASGTHVAVRSGIWSFIRCSRDLVCGSSPDKIDPVFPTVCEMMATFALERTISVLGPTAPLP